MVVVALAGCTAPFQLDWVRQPQIRVGLVEGQEQVDFVARDDFTIRNYDGSFVARGVKGQRWRAQVVGGVPAEREYRLEVTISRSEEIASRRAAELTATGFPAIMEPVHKDYPPAFLGREEIRTYRVLLEASFPDSLQAATYRQQMEQRLETRVVARPTSSPQGRLVITNLENRRQRFESTQPMRISGSHVALLDVEFGSGYHWASSEHRAYGGMLEFVLDKDARITVVNLVPIETYLAGVVPYEMPRGFPAEALKAQAVAARTEVMSKLGIRHPDEPFDVCDEVHCQVYGGLGREAASTSQAVAATRGLVMTYNGGSVNAVYSAVCGGHTENNENVWGGDPAPYLRGILDADLGSDRLPSALRDGEILRSWVEAYPEVYCNTVTHPIPPALEYTQKYFRWEVKYSQSELEEILRQKTGRSFGSLVDLVPLERGVSGRIVRLQVIGTDASFVLQRELTIRRSLSPNALFSAAFVVDKISDPEGQEPVFGFRGAGWGHGVGMCQTGAAGMALAGKRFTEILAHYYTGIELERAY